MPRAAPFAAQPFHEPEVRQPGPMTSGWHPRKVVASAHFHEYTATTANESHSAVCLPAKGQSASSGIVHGDIRPPVGEAPHFARRSRLVVSRRPISAAGVGLLAGKLAAPSW